MNASASPPVLLLAAADEERRVIAEMLSSLGRPYHLPFAESTALDMLLRGESDLLVFVPNAPEEAIELLSRTAGGDADVIVVLPAGDRNGAFAARLAGAADVVWSPPRSEELAWALDRVEERRRLQGQVAHHRKELEVLVQERLGALFYKTQEVERLNRELVRSHEATLQALMSALDFRDNETQGHSLRVVEYAGAFAEHLGVDSEGTRYLRWGAILHDVGKIGVPDAILLKRDPLSPEEWALMRRHAEIGHAMLQHLGYLGPALEVVRHHHERWDGAGYPDGLAGEAIPFAARAFAVVDAFDALTSDRPYRRAVSMREAAAVLATDAGSHFDPNVVDVFCSVPLERWQELRDWVSGDATGILSRLSGALA